MNVRRVRSLVLAALVPAVEVLGCDKSRTAELSLPPPKTVAAVDLDRYAGKWYEIARLPNSFQEGCTNTSATYTRKAESRVHVLNECDKPRESGSSKHKSMEGTAHVLTGSGGAKLEVTFLWPFKGDYWILELAPDYSYAAVGAPTRNNLWILSRSPKMKDEIYRELVKRLKADGFDTDKLIKAAP
jgi:apolipoprotein D and lipocalin family protein